jgi:methyl-accepting chemotaxis protein
MPRRTKQIQGESSKEKVARRKTTQAPAETVPAKRRGRPKKSAESKVEAKKPAKKTAKPDETETLQLESESIAPEPKKIVLKHFTAEEIELETKRKRVMWVSVSFVAILVLFVWMANLKRIVGADAASGGSLISFEEFKDNFSDNFKRINASIADLKKEVASSSDGSTQAATSSNDYDTNIDEINKELKELIINASSTIASTTINNN